MSFSQRTSWFQQRPVWFHQLLTFATSSINRHSQDRICTPHMWSQNGARANGCKFPAFRKAKRVWE